MDPQHVQEFDYLPHARVEAVIADARVLLAVGALVAYWVDPQANAQTVIHTLLLAYALYSLSAAALLRHGTWLSPAEQVIVHSFDLAAFSLFIVITQAAASPYFVYFAFSVVCGALRWDSRGAAATAAVAIGAFVALSLYATQFPPEEVDRLVIRSVQLVVVAGLLGFFSTYHPRVQRELLALASWPHRLPRDVRSVAAEIIERAEMILPTRLVVLVWELPEEERTHLVWRNPTGIQWHHEPAGGVDAIIARPFRDQDFQAARADRPAGRLLLRSRRRYREGHGQPLDAAFRTRFDVKSVQACCVNGEIVTGRLFWINRRRMRIDDLIVGELVARLAGARLDAVYFLGRLEESAALNERVRVARDVHDSLMQTLTGTALQLTAAGRLLDRDPDAARHCLSVAREEVEESEQAMRRLIRRLRPRATVEPTEPSLTIESRLLRFAQRIEEQWPVKIVLVVPSKLDRLNDATAEEVMLIVREAVLNAARHAAASAIHVSLGASDDQRIQIGISDDGKGFPFKGVYDLAALDTHGYGPLTLKERVAALGGSLQIMSGDGGSEVLVTLPTGARS